MSEFFKENENRMEQLTKSVYMNMEKQKDKFYIVRLNRENLDLDIESVK